MAETQDKRTDASTPENTGDNGVNKQTNNAGQVNSQAGKGGATSGASLPDPKEIIQQAKETAGQAYGKVTEQASTTIGVQKDNLARGLSSVADGIRQMGENLRGNEQQTPIAGLTAKYGDSLAEQVEQISNYLEKKDLRELVRDVEVFAKRNPAVFLGGAFALGIVAARFLKSGNPNQALMRRPRRQREGVYIPDESEGVYLPENLSRKVGLGNSSSGSSNTTGTSNTGSSSSNSVAGGSNNPSTNANVSTGNATDNNNSTTNDRTSSDAFSPNKGG